MRYEISSKADRQIDEIIAFTDDWFGTDQTSAYLYGLYDSFDVLADNPHYGRPWRGIYYRYPYQRHWIYYRIDRRGSVGVPVIVNIVHQLRGHNDI